MRSLHATAAAALASLLLGAQLAARPAAAQEETSASGDDATRRERAAELFARLDRDGDGALRGDELPSPTWLERFDRDGDDVVQRREHDVVMQRPPGLDRLWPLRDPRARARNALGQFDRDKDGRVAADEYPGGEKAFRGADRNRDGFLDRRELLGLAEDELGDIRRRCRSPGRYEFLALFDLDYDRKVTQGEYDGPARSFRRLDENGDGTVDYYEIYPQRRPDPAEAAPRAADIDVIESMDGDRDGRVSREEWKGSEAGWLRLDRNGDGWITGADAR